MTAAAAVAVMAAAAAGSATMSGLSPAVSEIRPGVGSFPVTVAAPYRPPRAVEHRAAVIAGAAYAQAVEQARLEAAGAYVQAVDEARVAAYAQAVEQARLEVAAAYVQAVEQASVEASNGAGTAVTPTTVLSALGFDPGRYAPGWTINWEGHRPDIRGIADPNSRTITIYLREGLSAAAMAYVLAHELGHVVNYDRFPGGSGDWMAARGLGGPWYNGTYGDTATPAGDWAEAFAWTVTGGATGERYSQLGPPPAAAPQAPVHRPAG